MTSQAPSRRHYEIVVGGRLSERYGAALEGMTLEPRSGQTMLRGDFATSPTSTACSTACGTSASS